MRPTTCAIPETLSHALASLHLRTVESPRSSSLPPRCRQALSDIVHLMEALGVDVAEDPRSARRADAMGHGS